MTIVDNAVYVNGYRTDDPQNLDQNYEMMRTHAGLAWIDLDHPDEAEIQSITAEFGLHELAVRDTLHGHQRAKLEHYGDIIFTVLRPARYRDETEKVEFGELHVFIGPDFVVTIEQTQSPHLDQARKKLEAAPKILALGPLAVLYGILNEVVDGYTPVVSGLENDIDEIEDDLFGASADVARRIYELSREVIEFQRATHPLGTIVETLQQGSGKYVVDTELQDRLHNIHNRIIRVVERGDAFRLLLQNALSVHATLVAQRQNEEMRRLSESSLAQNEDVKKISSWAAILFAPTVVGTVYGMNFHSMPELGWLLGYPLAVGLMVTLSVGLYVTFKRRGWL